ncbi:MAG: delta-60 repeat domain-containing protein [Longimicrobiales bacterium]
MGVQTPLMVPGRAIALQPDGKIVIAGVEQSGASADYAIARFTPTGELDTSFGTDGLIQVDFFGDLDIANAVALQPDGKVGVAGSVRKGASTLLGLIRIPTLDRCG